MSKMDTLKLNCHKIDCLVGCLLGDAHLEEAPNGKSWRLKIEQNAIKHKRYFDSLVKLWSSWITGNITTRKQTEQDRQAKYHDKPNRFFGEGNLKFNTAFSKEFAMYAKAFYSEKEGKRRKIAPEQLENLLNARAFTYWWMDDGSKKGGQAKAVILNTQNYTYEEVVFLCKVLNINFDLHAKPRPETKKGCATKYQIIFSGSDFERLDELMSPFIDPDLRSQKFPPPRVPRSKNYKKKQDRV